ncbi:MAG: hypothetical protein PHR80_03280 [Candidatus Rickettsiella isopodorum]|jgi:hypothetical protein|nr:hypothetical protein [Candidatus Rickettsiella isopodorum]
MYYPLLRREYNQRIKEKITFYFTGFKSYSDILVKLTIKTAMLTQESFIKILNLLPALEFLSLELDWSSNRYEWKQLSHVFIEHSNLKYLDFGTTPLDTEAYSWLSFT